MSYFFAFFVCAIHKSWCCVCVCLPCHYKQCACLCVFCITCHKFHCFQDASMGRIILCTWPFARFYVPLLYDSVYWICEVSVPAQPFFSLRLQYSIELLRDLPHILECFPVQYWSVFPIAFRYLCFTLSAHAMRGTKCWAGRKSVQCPWFSPSWCRNVQNLRCFEAATAVPHWLLEFRLWWT